ncbi:Mysoin-binding motif of peroxisomes-domain-containing protein [Emericellopsis atlantica]|uniref:Vezatin n=1 Tax=Emericellopsis atlantica TaxID=2614577 RepID=A0A9P7ZEK0_9HYPO|nr:Mysoin-binding motif of peroxisomes-domain-containing protein [Emericellopsis atlantica]KAG9250023.1 Mysoin-binding motif of peroxisomes-domain-containing protein [Emericellopsis atlantica]
MHPRPAHSTTSLLPAPVHPLPRIAVTRPVPMEPVVYEETPLAAYLRADAGSGDESEWGAAVQQHDDDDDVDGHDQSSVMSTSPSPSPRFAPTGRPHIRGGPKKSAALPRLDIRPLGRGGTAQGGLKRNYSTAMAASIDRADNAKFLEKFRYVIVASQLLSGHSIPGPSQGPLDPGEGMAGSDGPTFSTEGMAASVLGALAVATVLSWVLGKGTTRVTKKRLVFLVALAAAGVLVGQVYMKRQWLRYRREQSLAEVAAFVAASQELDGVVGSALSLIQDVGLVSRGYRISAPLPPVSRIEDKVQDRKCARLRKALRSTIADVLKTYIQVSTVVRGFAEQTNLEKYLDIYEISDFDISDANRGFDEEEFDDPESLRTLKIAASRFHIIRKVFLCSLLALDANGESSDLMRWTTAVEALRSLNDSTKASMVKLRDLLHEEESFPPPSAPKTPLTPGRERWRSQLHKLNSLGSGIRGLGAKLQLLREESDRALNDSQDLTELAPHLLTQYESIGSDLKELMAVWEEGKAALAQGIDRNEKRLSSMSALISPTTSLSGLTTVDEEGDAAAALKKLTGESPLPSDEPEREVFEAVALPRQRSTLTREERIAKVKEEREQRATARQHVEATRGMMKELETVINLRPRTRTSAPPGNTRVMSM